MESQEGFRLSSSQGDEGLWVESFRHQNSGDGYATQDAQEWFAECFCEWMDSENPRPVAVEFGKQLLELMKGMK